MHNDAIVGVAPEFSYNENLKINDVKINFDLDNSIVNDYNSMYNDVSDEFVGIKRFNVFRYFEDTNMLLPIETFHDVQNNRVYAHYNEMGTYCLIDMTKWLDSLGYMDNSDQSTMTFAMERTAEATESNEIDIIFILHSIPSQAQFIKEELTKFISAAYMHSNDVRMYFIANQGDVYLVNGKQYAETPAECENILNRFRGYVTSPTINAGFEAANKIEFRNGSQRHMFMIDACAEPQCIDTNANLNIILKKDVNFGIVFDPANGNAKNYKSLANNNTFDAIVTFSDFMLNQINFTDYPKNKEYIITSNGLSPLPDDFGKITKNSDKNYDKDGLDDVQEIHFDAKNKNGNNLVTVKNDGTVILPSFNECVAAEETYVQRGLIRFYNDMSNLTLDYFDRIKVLPLISDPTRKDGDGDGICDTMEIGQDYLNGVSSKAFTDPLYTDTIVNVLRYDEAEFTTNIDGKVNMISETGEATINPAYTLAKEHEKEINGLKEGIEFSYGYMGDDTEVFYLEAYAYRIKDNEGDYIIKNKLRINTNIKFEQNSLKLSNCTISKDQILENIRDKWQRTYGTSDYDLYNLKNLEVELSFNMITVHNSSKEYLNRNIGYINKDVPGKPEIYELNGNSTNNGKKVEYSGNYANFILNQTNGHPHTSLGTSNGSLSENSTVYIFSSNEEGETQSDKITYSSCAHEFGHVLGLGDVYGKDNLLNYHIEPISQLRNNDELYFKFGYRKTDGKFDSGIFGTESAGEMMHRSGVVSANDIEMVLYARKTNKLQFYVPFGRECKKNKDGTYTTKKKYRLSPAVRSKYFYICTNDIDEDGLKFESRDILWYDGEKYNKFDDSEETKSNIKKVWGKMFNEEYYNHAVNLLNDEYLLECYFNNYIYGKSK